MPRLVLPFLSVVAFAGPALAHPGHEVAGFLHPFTGIDHLLAMLAVGVWASFLGARRRPATFLVPAAFLAMMALGAVAGFAGMKLPLAEAAIVISVFVLGALTVAAVRLRAAWAMAVVGMFALFHGYAHALDSPGGPAGGYALSFLLATAVLLGAGSGLGWAVRRFVGDLGLRALGGLVMAGGALVLAGW